MLGGEDLRGRRRDAGRVRLQAHRRLRLRSSAMSMNRAWSRREAMNALTAGGGGARQVCRAWTTSYKVFRENVRRVSSRAAAHSPSKRRYPPLCPPIGRSRRGVRTTPCAPAVLRCGLVVVSSAARLCGGSRCRWAKSKEQRAALPPGAIAPAPGGHRWCAEGDATSMSRRGQAAGAEGVGCLRAARVRQMMASRSTSSSTLCSVSPGGSRPARVRVASPCRAAQNTSVNSPG